MVVERRTKAVQKGDAAEPWAGRCGGDGVTRAACRSTEQSLEPPSVLSDLFESLVAAVYLDGGLEPVRRLVGRFIEPEIIKVASGEQGSNHKSLLQQVAQRDFGVTPTYEVIEEAGPDHSKSFHVAAQIAGRSYSPAWGRNKKEAEQRAACNALSELQTEG